MGLNFNILTKIVANEVGYGAEQGHWCCIAIFICLLWFVTLFLLCYRIESCKKLKQELGYDKKDKTGKKV